MFNRARRRLAILYVGLFASVLIAFSLAVYWVLAMVLQPNFDIAPDTSNDRAAEIAYDAALEQIGVALLVGNAVTVVVVGVAASFLARRTLAPVREAHERQRRFVADASHEMRSPLAAIRSSAEGALAVAEDPVEARRSLLAIVDATDRLGSLTNDLLVLARSETGYVERPREAVDLAVLAAEAVEAAQRDMGGAHPQVVLALAPDIVVRASADETGRIILNLVGNALRYTPTDERVTVRVSGTDRHGSVEVSDTGPGIAEADLERVFEPFYRVRASADAPRGSGLGLAIAQGLARQNGGRVTATSGVGMGSTFRLTLPRTR
jgi:signal transduction histidine kinase